MVEDDDILLLEDEIQDEEGDESLALGLIPIELFRCVIAVFASDSDRLHELLTYGIHATPVGGSYRAVTCTDYDDQGAPYFSVILTPEGMQDPSIWAHEAVHAADLVMDHVGMPGSIENTETRAYLTQHIFSGIGEILVAYQAQQVNQGAPHDDRVLH